jgi:glucose-6-phosphate isomerase
MMKISEDEMDPSHLWQKLLAHPMSEWRSPGEESTASLNQEGRLLWCGIGGSLLPADALVNALGDPSQRSRWQPLASPEPFQMALDPSDQLVFASKSGRTLELWTWIGRLRASSGWGRWKCPPIAITQDDANPLAQWARSEGWTVLPIPENVGGRYSAFTAIGSLPLRWMSLDAVAFLKGAARVAQDVAAQQNGWGQRVWNAVEAWQDGYLRGVDQWVLLPYANRLESVGAWWVQLVAESLGKVGQGGIRRGITPIRAIGPQDQHAQLQRWLDGPRNVGVVLVTVGNDDTGEASKSPSLCPFPGLDRWTGSEILRAQAEGTREAIESAGVPVLHWHLDALDESTLGAFLMSWQLIAGLVGLSLELDPFDQPAVEAGKRRTLVKLGMV